MPPEVALLESRALRESVSTRTDVLDRALVLLPDGLHVTTRMVADYFEVGEKAVNSLMQRHREELESNGFRILTGSNALELVNFNLKSTQVSGRASPWGQSRSGVAADGADPAHSAPRRGLVPCTADNALSARSGTVQHCARTRKDLIRG